MPHIYIFLIILPIESSFTFSDSIIWDEHYDIKKFKTCYVKVLFFHFWPIYIYTYMLCNFKLWNLNFYDNTNTFYFLMKIFQKNFFPNVFHFQWIIEIFINFFVHAFFLIKMSVDKIVRVITCFAKIRKLSMDRVVRMSYYDNMFR
jgi:hypothetical protein